MIPPVHYKLILDLWSGVSEFYLFCQVPSNFQYRAPPDFKMEKFHIYDGHWIHLEDIMNCKEVTIFNNSNQVWLRWANAEVLRGFTQKWIEADCQLEHIKLHSYPAEINNIGEIFSGLGER
ncbi:hypothetical protein CRE_04199 [Caenorhabditis remanei]|uniref:F-box associated domain-containing protein n=1 Tax=Caenorhabditis remanei TaxID=31234 RepID=E3MYY9_CAERE|nr:hypothetical protein CRE_04199 [Caenorhabditis remanei]